MDRRHFLQSVALTTAAMAVGRLQAATSQPGLAASPRLQPLTPSQLEGFTL
jgi:hypothetical protein